jgi:hypothetical protein
MKQLTKAGILAVSAALISQAAQAQFTANNLYLGLTQSTATSDYLINLGAASSITGQSTVVDLSNDFSLGVFNPIFTGGATGVSMGVVGGAAHPPSTTYDIYTTAPIGADLSGFSINSANLASSVQDLTAIAFPSVGPGVGDTNKMWTTYVAPTLAAGTFYGDSGINPDSAIGGSGVINEGLWEATAYSNYAYLGYFTLDTTGASPSLTFTSINVVPEPTTASFLIGGGLLLSMIRRRSIRKMFNNL